MPAKVITWTPPLAAPTGLTPSLGAGGSLSPNTAYHYAVAAVGIDAYFLNVNFTISPIAETNITTDATNKTVNLSWNAVPGAVGYLIWRTTGGSGKYYDRLSRLPRLSDGSGYYATVSTNSASDNGSRTPTVFGWDVVRQNAPVALGLDPYTYGIGQLAFQGGDPSNKITPADLVAAVGNANYCTYQGNVFKLLGQFIINAAETHLQWDMVDLFIYGAMILKTHANSNVKFGSYGSQPWHGESVLSGCNFHTRGDYSGLYLYGGEFNRVLVDNPRENSLHSEFNDYQYSYINTFVYGGVFREFVAEPLPYRQVGDCYMEGIKAPLGTVQVPLSLQSNFRSLSYLVTYGTLYVHRLDRFASYRKDRQIRVQDNSFIKLVEPAFPYSTHSQANGVLPVIEWATAGAQTGFVDIYFPFLLKSEAGATLTVKDKDGNIVNDFLGNALNQLAADADGHFWTEKLTVTGATSTTITDSSKSWTTNQWKGAWVVIRSGQGANQSRMVISNTATTLTLGTPLSIVPAVGDRGGIRIEVRYCSCTKNGTGTGYSEALTTYGIKTPHTIIIEKPGYQTYEDVIEVDRKMDLEVALLPSPPPVYIGVPGGEMEVEISRDTGLEVTLKTTPNIEVELN